MDPRTSAIVTAPDLLEAFHESAPKQGESSGKLTVYLVLLYGEQVVSANDFPALALRHVMQIAADHMKLGDKRCAVVMVDSEIPPIYQDALDTVSAIGV